MKELSVFALLVIVGAAAPNAAAGQGCQYHNFAIDFSSGAPSDPGSYDFCVGDFVVTGTLHGVAEFCFYFDDFLTSDSIYGDGVNQVEAVKYYGRATTDKGDLDFVDWGWFDGDTVVEAGIAKITGGTGVFDGNFGILSWAPRFPNPRNVDSYEGYICAPTD